MSGGVTPSGVTPGQPAPYGGTAPAGGPSRSSPTAKGNLSTGVPADSFPADFGFQLGSEKPIVPKPVIGPNSGLPGSDDDLIKRVETFLAAGDPSPLDAQLLLDALTGRMVELSAQLEGKNSEAKGKEIEENGKKREEQIKIAADKSKAAEEKGFWSKLWGVVKAVASVVASAAMVVAGAALTAVAGPVGIAVMAIGLYTMASAVVDVVSAIKEAAGGEPITWRPTLGELAGLIAKAAGADEETQMKWKLGVDVAVTVVVIAVSFFVPGGQAKALSKMGDVTAQMGRMIKLAQAGSKVAAGGNLVGGAAAVGQGVTNIALARDRYDMKVAQGTLDRLQALYDQLNAVLEQSGDRMKNLQDVMLSIWDSSSEKLKTFNESTNTVFRLA
jgi:hypothetical protein